MIEEYDINPNLKILVNSSKSIELFYFLLSIYIFFGYLLPKIISYAILVVVVIGLSIYILKNKIVPEYNTRLLYGLMVMFILVNLLQALFFSKYPERSIKVSITRGSILMVGLLLYILRDLSKNGIRYLLYFSMVHCFFTLFQYFFPNVFKNYILILLPSDISDISLKFFSQNLYAGITNQIGRNSYYISIGIAIIYCYLISTSKNFFKKNKALMESVIFIMLLLSLLLTGKRGSLIASIASMFFMNIINAKVKGKNQFFVLMRTLIIVTVIILILIYIIPSAVAPFKRFYDRIGGDMSSGRFDLYKSALKMFKEKPLFGWGPGAFNAIHDTGVHNVYLQVLAENGMIGFINFIAIVIINFITIFRTIRLLASSETNQYHKYFLFSLYFQVFFILYSIFENSLNDGFVIMTYLIASSIPYALKYKTEI
jgi:O-antigen ligase